MVPLLETAASAAQFADGGRLRDVAGQVIIDRPDALAQASEFGIDQVRIDDITHLDRLLPGLRDRRENLVDGVDRPDADARAAAGRPLPVLGACEIPAPE